MELYAHIPFCKARCAYCDFFSTTEGSSARKPYLSALIREAGLAASAFGDRRIDTVYIGGGTPSLLETDEIALLAGSLARLFPRFSPREFTVECNPESATAEKFAAWREHGADRISMGIQTLSDGCLKAMGRLHTAAEGLEKLTLAGKFFPRVSCDIIVGLPTDSVRSVREEVKRVSELAGHVSVYQLTLAEGTRLAADAEAGRISLPSDDETADLAEAAADALEEEGLSRYEVSNFARRGEESLHNLGYWTREEYIGLGASAHSFFGASAESARRDGTRVSNVSDLAGYAEGVNGAESFFELPRASRERVTGKDAEDEEIMLGLRTSRGIAAELLSGRDAASVRDLLEYERGRVRLTRRGFAVMNSVLTRLL